MLTTLDQPATTHAEYATFWKRLLAAVLDFIFTLPLFFGTSFFLSFNPNFNGYLVMAVIYMLYRPVMEGLFGATLGKMACKLIVRRADGGAIGLQEALLRFVPWLVPSMIGIYYASKIFALPGYLEVDGFVEMGLFMQGHMDELSATGNLANASQLIPLLSALVILFTARNQSAHDLLAQTVVLEK